MLKRVSVQKHRKLVYDTLFFIMLSFKVRSRYFHKVAAACASYKFPKVAVKDSKSQTQIKQEIKKHISLKHINAK